MARLKSEALAFSPASDLMCSTCGLDLGAIHITQYGKFSGWKKGPVFHCEGSDASVFCTNRKVHHSHRAFSCPKCNRGLGCDRCTTTAICKICMVQADWAKIVPWERATEMMRLVEKVGDRSLTVEDALAKGGLTVDEVLHVFPGARVREARG